MATVIPAPSGVTVFQGRATAAINLGATANTITPISLGVEDQDDLNGHDNTTNPTRYVCKKAGRYCVSGTILLAANATATSSSNFGRASTVLKNGAGLPGASFWSVYVTNAILSVPVMPYELTLALNDYVEIACSSNLTNTMTYYDTAHHSMMRVNFVQ